MRAIAQIAAAMLLLASSAEGFTFAPAPCARPLPLTAAHPSGTLHAHTRTLYGTHITQTHTLYGTHITQTHTYVCDVCAILCVCV